MRLVFVGLDYPDHLDVFSIGFGAQRDHLKAFTARGGDLNSGTRLDTHTHILKPAVISIKKNLLRQPLWHELWQGIFVACRPSGSTVARKVISGRRERVGLQAALHGVPDLLIGLADADVEGRKDLLGDIVRKHYAAALSVSDENGTASQLDGCFRDSYAVVGADTLRKSTSFFLHASRTAGIALSPHFKQTRGGQGAPGQPKRKAFKRKSNAGSSVATEPPMATVHEYRLDVNLRTGGTMTLTVDVNPISLRGDERAFFYDIIDKMTNYNEVVAAQSFGGTSEEEGPLEPT